MKEILEESGGTHYGNYPLQIDNRSGEQRRSECDLNNNSTKDGAGLLGFQEKNMNFKGWTVGIPGKNMEVRGWTVWILGKNMEVRGWTVGIPGKNMKVR